MGRRCVTRSAAQSDEAAATALADELDLEAERGEVGSSFAEALGETFGSRGPAFSRAEAWGGQQGEELGGGAAPEGALAHESTDGAGDGVVKDGRLSERGEDGLRGGMERGGGGNGPGGEVGEAGRLVELYGVEVAEGGADGGAECGEEAGAGGVEAAPEVGLGAAAMRWDGGQGDGEGAVGQIGVRAPARAGGGVGGDGEDDGALEGEGQGLALIPALVEEEGGGGGEAAEGVGEVTGEGGDMVEGQDPIVEGEGEELAVGGGQRAERGGGGIDQGAEHTGGGGLAAAGRSVEDENGVGAGGAESGEEPGEAAEPVLVGGEVEEGTEGGEVGLVRGPADRRAVRLRRRGGGGLRAGGGLEVSRQGFLGEGVGEGEVAAAGAEVDVGSGEYFPAGGRDPDDFVVTVSEVEDDEFGRGVGGVRGNGAGGGDAPVDGLNEALAVGAGLGEAKDLAQGLVGGQDLEFVEEAVEEPIAEAGGANGPDLVPVGDDGEADEGLAEVGGEGEGAGGVAEELFELGGRVVLGAVWRFGRRVVHGRLQR
jgi:hypothetical protein